MKMIKCNLSFDEDYELLGVPYHDMAVAKFEFSEREGVVELHNTNGAERSKIVADSPIEYNISNVFRDSIIGLAVFGSLYDIYNSHSGKDLLSHIIGNRIVESDVPNFVRRVCRDRQCRFLQLQTIDGGLVSVIGVSFAGFIEK